MHSSFLSQPQQLHQQVLAASQLNAVSVPSRVAFALPSLGRSTAVVFGSGAAGAGAGSAHVQQGLGIMPCMPQGMDFAALGCLKKLP
jgi:hypothetical protein